MTILYWGIKGPKENLSVLGACRFAQDATDWLECGFSWVSSLQVIHLWWHLTLCRASADSGFRGSTESDLTSERDAISSRFIGQSVGAVWSVHTGFQQCQASRGTPWKMWKGLSWCCWIKLSWSSFQMLPFIFSYTCQTRDYTRQYSDSFIWKSYLRTCCWCFLPEKN